MTDVKFTVEMEPKWPFRIRIMDGNRQVAEFDRVASSSDWKTLEDVRSAKDWKHPSQTQTDVCEMIARQEREVRMFAVAVSIVQQELTVAVQEASRPSVLFRPEIRPDGNMYCALYGEDLMDGCAGFGATVESAMRDFDKNWASQKAPHVSAGGEAA